MTSVSELSDSQLRYLTEVDHHDHEALIAFDAATGEGGRASPGSSASTAEPTAPRRR